ncbi:unnamed protein product [Lepeophtheirus salmonis]|uniref:(salmon louse) hypothetical protein n=1 Tax=Lepeophtheirus salmonis TaxID=72036 RepID=A0A7R8CYB3_LEPSM|nr:unnamed protein product [Lepeophtheirus salmonis]CAF2967496.1 unnamed protein product [Lepeophtheirus salmonis]
MSPEMGKDKMEAAIRPLPNQTDNVLKKTFIRKFRQNAFKKVFSILEEALKLARVSVAFSTVDLYFFSPSILQREVAGTSIAKEVAFPIAVSIPGRRHHRSHSKYGRKSTDGASPVARRFVITEPNISIAKFGQKEVSGSLHRVQGDQSRRWKSKRYVERTLMNGQQHNVRVEWTKYHDNRVTFFSAAKTFTVDKQNNRDVCLEDTEVNSKGFWNAVSTVEHVVG